MFGVPLWAVLATLTAFAALIMRDRCMAWVGACLLGNWIANTILANATGTQFNWLAMGTIDYVTAIAILCPPLRRWQVAIAFLYAAELIAHASFAFTDEGHGAQVKYWWGLHYLAWGQAALLGGWAYGDGVKGAWDRWGNHRRLRPVHTVLHGLGFRDQRGGMK
jgi:hypothetical protein